MIILAEKIEWWVFYKYKRSSDGLVVLLDACVINLAMAKHIHDLALILFRDNKLEQEMQSMRAQH
jgi:hypothetical protein